MTSFNKTTFKEVAEGLPGDWQHIAAQGPWTSHYNTAGGVFLKSRPQTENTTANLKSLLDHNGIEYDQTNEGNGLSTICVSNPDSIKKIVYINNTIAQTTLGHLAYNAKEATIDLDSSQLSNTALVRSFETAGIEHRVNPEGTVTVEANALKKIVDAPQPARM